MTTKAEFETILFDLKKKYESDKQAIQIAFAKQNNPYKIGDVVEDHIGKLKIESIKFGHTFLSNEFQCIYYGQRLTKEGKPHKKEYSPVHQSNLRNHEKI